MNSLYAVISKQTNSAFPGHQIIFVGTHAGEISSAQGEEYEQMPQLENRLWELGAETKCDHVYLMNIEDYNFLVSEYHDRDDLLAAFTQKARVIAPSAEIAKGNFFSKFFK